MFIGPSGGQAGTIQLYGLEGVNWAWNQFGWDVYYNWPNRFDSLVGWARAVAQIG